MVEVFTTNVVEKSEAALLVEQIESSFPDYKANFDLEDCDRILRIKFDTGAVDAERVIKFLSTFGYKISLLPDTVTAKRKYPLQNVHFNEPGIKGKNPLSGFVTRIPRFLLD